MPYEDKDRAAKFYQDAFGWQSNKLGADMGNYVVVMTSETDEKAMLPKEAGRINGGLFHRTKPDQYPSVVVSTDDIHEAMKKVAAAGGKVIGGQKADGEPDEIPGVGLYSSIIDSEGNRMGILQPKGL